jgi:hypothetical protein
VATRLSEAQAIVPSALLRKVLNSSLFARSPPLQPEPATPSARPGSGQRSPSETRKPCSSAVREALCRTRTGDPFLTIAVRSSVAMSDAEPNFLHAPVTRTPQPAAPIGTSPHPPVPRGYLGLRLLEAAELAEEAAKTRLFPGVAFRGTPRRARGDRDRARRLVDRRAVALVRRRRGAVTRGAPAARRAPRAPRERLRRALPRRDRGISSTTTSARSTSRGGCIRSCRRASRPAACGCRSTPTYPDPA